jgi:hypothetical protein
VREVEYGQTATRWEGPSNLVEVLPRDLDRLRRQLSADYYEKGGRMLNPLLINIREDDFDRVRVVVDGGDGAQTRYQQAVAEDGNWVGSGYIEFGPDLPLWIYDGQHRHAGWSDCWSATRASTT